MRPTLLFAILLASCAAPDSGKVDPVFNGPLTYPKTQIQVSSGMKLIHEAGALDSEGRSYVGTPRASDVSSKWTLRANNESDPLITALSNLTDPTYAGEFEAYNRENDRITIFESKTGSTVLVVEDRSPAYPNKDYILFRRLPNGSWSVDTLKLEPYRRDGDPDHAYAVFPEIINLTDSGLRCSASKGTRWVKF